MGLILDTSILIADERGKFDMPAFLRQFPTQQPLISAITASELLHGVERAQDASRRTRRQQLWSRSSPLCSFKPSTLCRLGATHASGRIGKHGA